MREKEGGREEGRKNEHALYVNYSTDNGNMIDECELEIYDTGSLHKINKSIALYRAMFRIT